MVNFFPEDARPQLLMDLALNLRAIDFKNNVGLKIRLSEGSDPGSAKFAGLADLAIHEEESDNRGRMFGM